MIHIHNGDLVAEAARRTGIAGEHLAFREALATGPVPRGVDIETRAQFLASASHEHPLRIRNGLIDQERALDAAMAHDEVVLWFEHDLFCLVNLLSLLERLASCRRLTLIWHPEPLPQVDLFPLFESRAAVVASGERRRVERRIDDAARDRRPRQNRRRDTSDCHVSPIALRLGAEAEAAEFRLDAAEGTGMLRFGGDGEVLAELALAGAEAGGEECDRRGDERGRSRPLVRA